MKKKIDSKYLYLINQYIYMSLESINFIKSNKDSIDYSKPILIKNITGSKKYSYNYIVPIVGRLIFRFDNSHAWLWNKNISFTISKNIEPKNNSPTHVLSKIKDIALKGYFGTKDFQIEKIDNNNYKLKNIKKSNSIYIDVEEKDNIEFSFSVDDDYDINFSLEFLIDLFSQLNKTLSTNNFLTFSEESEIKKLKEQLETSKEKITELETAKHILKDELNKTTLNCNSNHLKVTELKEEIDKSKFKIEILEKAKFNFLNIIKNNDKIIEQMKNKHEEEKEQLKYNLNSIININKKKHAKEIEELKEKKLMVPADENIGIICRDNQSKNQFVEILEFSKEEL